MQNIHFFERTISGPRLNSYRQKGGGDHLAMSRYLWNIALCEALYPTLNIMEVAFRNAVHKELSSVFKANNMAEDWLCAEILVEPSEKERIQKAKTSLQKAAKPITEAFLVSELSFGFWTSIMDVRYHRVWPKIIANVFPQMPKRTRTRQDASPRVERIRKLRNAALHHHSIWHWGDLLKQHADLLGVLGWICPSALTLANSVDRFPQVHAGGEGQFTTLVQNNFP